MASASHRSFLSAAAAGSIAAAGTVGAQIALAASAEPDPVFAFIRAANAAHERFAEICGETDEADIDQESDPGWNTACKAEDDALDAAFASQSTTAAGVAAIIDLFLQGEMDEVDTRAGRRLIDLFANVKAFVGQPVADGEV